MGTSLRGDDTLLPNPGIDNLRCPTRKRANFSTSDHSGTLIGTRRRERKSHAESERRTRYDSYLKASVG